jgi:hypothetical protein
MSSGLAGVTPKAMPHCPPLPPPLHHLEPSRETNCNNHMNLGQFTNSNPAIASPVPLVNAETHNFNQFERSNHLIDRSS